MKVILTTIAALIISLPIIVYNFFYYDVYCLYGHYFKKHEKYYFENIELCKQYMEDEELDKQILKEYEKYKKLFKQSKSDPYGGKTPRETLDLFMQALENKDYKLASKYFVAEKQKEMEKILKDWIEGKLPNHNEYLKAYNTGTIEESVNPQMQIAQIEIRTKNDETPYWILLIPNPHTGLWKIKEF